MKPTPHDLLTAGPEHEPDETEQRECARCKERGDRARHVAAGNGTVEEIRDALAILESERRAGVKLGAKIKIDGRFYCPRCTSVDDREGATVPIISQLPNRAARRRAKLKRTT